MNTSIKNGEKLDASDEFFDFLNDSWLFMQVWARVPYLKQVLTFSDAYT